MNKLFCILFILCVIVVADDKVEKKQLDKDQLDVVGIWDQYIYYYKNGKYQYNYAGTFQVTKIKGKYYMKQVGDKLKSPELINSRGVTKIKFDGKVWTFYSDWGSYGIGFFKLKPKKRTVFEGHAYATDKKGKPTDQLSPNRWIRHEI